MSLKPPNPTSFEELLSIEGRLQRMPALDVREYIESFDLTGARDMSTSLQTAVDESSAGGKVLYLPAGTIAAGSVLLKSGTHIIGAAGFNTRLILPSLSYVGSVFGTGTAGVVRDDVILEDLVLDGQQQSRSVSAGNALLKAYKARRWTLRRLWIKNGTQYGFGFQGYPSETDPNKQYVSLDLLVEQCYFTDNGWIGGTVGVPRSGTNNSADNIDIKSSERVVLNKIYSAYSSDPCYDIRSRRMDLVGCVAEGGNGVGFDLDAHHPSATYTDNDSFISVLGGKSTGNLGTGITAQSTTGESDTHIDIVGFQSIGNGGSGMANNTPTAGGEVRLSIVGGKYIGNTNDGINVTGIQDLAITGAIVRGNGGDGIELASQSGGVISGNVCRGNASAGIRSSGTSDNLVIHGNDVRDNATALGLVGQANRVRNNVHASSAPTVASTANLTLPSNRGSTNGLVIVTGTNTISNIDRGYIGETVRLWFQASLTVQHNNSSILLNGDANKSVVANDVLELVCINVNFWRETSA